ncbi:DUF7065 domain-containing protein [Aromatoleum petrolei]|uniref:Uncharacterized protein n=1 Tax=Aromatoleum petrolei TaxID=76116 RepID=A0ABX1MTZ7_9RHOO|nr:hypothetical protein [Aromatoleum petrolei]NMF88587.1 hypothetical protein [Aromatoleum petrolei]
MGVLLTDADEGVHEKGEQTNWNESRYVDFWDANQRVGGWFRIGNRPNAGWAEMSACITLPDGKTAFMFERPKITANTLHSGNQQWEIVQPWVANRVQYRGELMVMDDPWILIDPKRAFETAPRAFADIDLVCRSTGLKTVMGFDQDHIDKIFLPGQAGFHYQHLARTTGTVRVGEHCWQVAGFGGKDHSWGPRNWHAKIYLRWLIAALDDDNGFMLVRAVGPTKKTRSGFVLDKGKFHLVDDFDMKNHYAGEPNFELRKVELRIRSGERIWDAVGTPQSWLPLRHKQHNEKGEEAILRIVKSPTDWQMAGRHGEGMCEYHDLMVDERPIGLED